MADHTKIEWTEATWNPITGCSVHSAGCTNCYAMKLAGTRLKNHPSRKGLTINTKAGPVWNGEVRLNEQWLDQPLDWKRPRMIFVCAHADLFHESVPDAWIDEIYARMAIAEQHTFQVLTKRAERMFEYFRRTPQPRWMTIMKRLLVERKVQPPEWGVTLKTTNMALKNVWCGISVENQAAADERIAYLRKVPAFVRWISAEPLLEHIEPDLSGIDWLVVGGESARNRVRAWSDQWARDLMRLCEETDTAFFMKQVRNKGAIPDDLLVRQMPKVPSGSDR